MLAVNVNAGADACRRMIRLVLTATFPAGSSIAKPTTAMKWQAWRNECRRSTPNTAFPQTRLTGGSPQIPASSTTEQGSTLPATPVKGNFEDSQKRRDPRRRSISAEGLACDCRNKEIL